MKCSAGSIITIFHLLGKAIETKAVHIAKATTTLLHNAITDLERLTELDVHKFIAVRAGPRAYMPPQKRDSLFRTAVSVRKKKCRFSKLQATYTTQLQHCTAHASVFC